MENNNNLVWENVTFKEPQLTIFNNNLYFNSAMRDILIDLHSTGIDLFKTQIEGKTVLSLKSGNQYHYIKKKNEFRIICKELVDYIQSVYDGKTHFKLVLTDGYYILQAE